jgi:hypothetical protein
MLELQSILKIEGTSEVLPIGDSDTFRITIFLTRSDVATGEHDPAVRDGGEAVAREKREETAAACHPLQRPLHHGEGSQYFQKKKKKTANIRRDCSFTSQASAGGREAYDRVRVLPARVAEGRQCRRH